MSGNTCLLACAGRDRVCALGSRQDFIACCPPGHGHEWQHLLARLCREKQGSCRGKPAPEELPLLEEGDLESPAQLSHAPLPPVADLPMPAEADARRVVSQVGL